MSQNQIDRMTHTLGNPTTETIFRAFEAMEVAEDHLRTIGYGPGANLGLSKPVNFTAFQAPEPMRDMPRFVYVAHVRELTYRLTLEVPDFSAPTHAEVLAYLFRAWEGQPIHTRMGPRFMSEEGTALLLDTFRFVQTLSLTGSYCDERWVPGAGPLLNKVEHDGLVSRQAVVREAVTDAVTRDRTHVREAS